MDQAQRDSRQKYFQEILLNIRDGKQMSIWFTDKFIEDLKTTHNLSVTTELLRSDIQEMAFIYLDEGPYGVRDPYVDLTKAASLNELVAQVGALRSTLSAYGREHWPGVLSELENSYIAMPKSFGTEFPSTAGLDSDRAAFIFTQRFLRALKKTLRETDPSSETKTKRPSERTRNRLFCLVWAAGVGSLYKQVVHNRCTQWPTHKPGTVFYRRRLRQDRS